MPFDPLSNERVIGSNNSNGESTSISGFRYGSEDNNDGAINFWQVLNVLRKWWWLIGLIAIVATSLTAFNMSRITPLYTAQVSLQVKQNERNVTGTDQVERVSADREFLNTQIELLQSESLAEAVIDSLQLLSDPDFVGNTNNAQGVTRSRERKVRQAIGVYKNRLSVKSIERSRVIHLNFIHSDPKKAALIANTVAELYISTDLQRKYDATTAARNFLENRLGTVKSSLEKAERDLVEYASNNDILPVSETDESAASLDKSALVLLNNNLTLARSERQQAQQAYEASLGDASFSLEILNDSALNALKSQRIELNAKYTEKLAVFKPKFPDMVELQNRIDLLDQAIEAQRAKTIEANRGQLKSKFDAAKSNELYLKNRVAELTNNVVDLRERSIDYTILKRQVDIERTQYEGLLQRLKELSVTDDIGTSLVGIVDFAKPASKPFKPNKLQAIMFALLLSSILGFTLAFIIELIDDRIKQPDDIKSKLNMVIMGVIPNLKETTALTEDLNNPQSSIAEAYAALRANLQFSAMNGGPRLIHITSTQPGEGKSVTSLGLAMRYAGLGEKTILIDADMRRPTFIMKNKSTIGLSGLLTQNVPINEHIQSTKVGHLDLITSGSSVPNPSEILTSTRFDEILAYARENYAYVIIDSPPVIGLADAPILGTKADASVLVVEANQLRTKSVKSSVERLSMSGTRLLGVVLTKYKSPGKGYSYYNYNYSYGSADRGKGNIVDKNGKQVELKQKQKFKLD